jgi:hypothetical protein
MAENREVLNMLIPNGGYIAVGEEYEGIQFIECEPITKKQWQDGFAKVDAWKDEQDAAKVAAKKSAQSKLAALGLTVEDLTALGL